MPARRVLVVDDEPRILDIVKYFLEQGGFEVEAVDGGEKALAAVRKKAFDVAVLDIVLVGDSGYEVAGKLKKIKNAETMPILFMSSKVEMADLFLENYDGRAEFLLKPFKKEALLDAVATLLKGGGREARKPAARGKKK
ncbi:MAG: response regulator [Planctomycetaceae bacterium]|nr:response regulator [Planctomycetaceae bacterium]